MEWGMQKIFVLLPSNSFKVWVFRLIFIVFVTEIFAWHTSSIVVMDSCLLWVCFSLKRSCRGTTSRDCSSSGLDKSSRVEKAHSDADNISVATALQPWLVWFSTRSTRVMYHPQVPRILSRVEHVTVARIVTGQLTIDQGTVDSFLLVEARFRKNLLHAPTARAGFLQGARSVNSQEEGNILTPQLITPDIAYLGLSFLWISNSNNLFLK